MKHHWNLDDVKRIAACDSSDGNGQTERVCIHCGIVKITVHPPVGYPWHKWRTKDGDEWQGEATPPCVRRELSTPALATNGGTKVIAI